MFISISGIIGLILVWFAYSFAVGYTNIKEKREASENEDLYDDWRDYDGA